jgi:hypothetical protein
MIILHVILAVCEPLQFYWSAPLVRPIDPSGVMLLGILALTGLAALFIRRRTFRINKPNRSNVSSYARAENRLAADRVEMRREGSITHLGRFIGNGRTWTAFVCRCRIFDRSFPMNGIIYLVGLVVVIMAILSFFGMR